MKRDFGGIIHLPAILSSLHLFSLKKELFATYLYVMTFLLPQKLICFKNASLSDVF